MLNLYFPGIKRIYASPEVTRRTKRLHTLLTLWPWNWTFKYQHIIYVKCEYFTNQKGNVVKYTTFCRGIN